MTGVSDRPARPLYLKVEGQVGKVDQDRFVIGRVSKMCDLAIIDVNISRQHCAVERREGKYYIVDLGSTNGVQLDGVRVDNHEIAEGDVFVLSGHEMRASFFAPLPDSRPAEASRAPVSEPLSPAVTGRHEPVSPVTPVTPAKPIATGVSAPVTSGVASTPAASPDPRPAAAVGQPAAGLTRQLVVGRWPVFRPASIVSAILNVDQAQTVVVIKRSLSPGFAGIPNQLFANNNTLMLFSDGKKAIRDLATAVKEL